LSGLFVPLICLVIKMLDIKKRFRAGSAKKC
jgi:hypothetical protein